MIANDPPAQLKARLGSTVIEIGLADAFIAKRAQDVLTHTSTLTKATLDLRVTRGLTAAAGCADPQGWDS